MTRKLQIKTVFKGVDRMTRVVSRMQRKLGAFTRSAVRGMKRIQKVTRATSKVIGRGLKMGIKGATAALVVFGAVAARVISVGADFGRTLVIAASKFPGKIRKGSEAFQKLEDAARQAGSTTEFTAKQAAEGLKFLGAAGLDANAAVLSLTDGINFATASELELGDAVKKSVLILGAFGMASEDAEQNQANLTRVMDNMKNASDSAAQEMEDVFEAMRKMAPTAETFGQKIETAGAAVIALAKAGIQGAEAGTAYRNIMLRLANPVGKAKTLIKEFAIDLEDSAGNMRDPINILGQFSKALDGMGSRQKAAALDVIFGKKAIDAATKLIGFGTDKLKAFEKAGQDAGGTVKEIGEAIRNTAAGSIDSLSSAIEGLIIDLFKLEDEGIKGAIDGITNWIRENKKLIATKVGEFLKDLIAKFKEFIQWARDVKLLDKLAAAFSFIGSAIAFVIEHIKPLSALVAVILTIAGVVEVLTAATAIFNLVVLANPLVLIFTAIAILVAATAIAIIANWDDIVWFFKEIGGNIADIFTGLWGGIVELFGKAKEFFKGVWNDVLGVFGFGDDNEIQVKVKGPPKLRSIDGGAGRGMERDEGRGAADSSESISRFFDEQRTSSTSRNEVTIKDATGRAEVTRGEQGNGFVLERTGTFE